MKYVEKQSFIFFGTDINLIDLRNGACDNIYK